MANKRSLYREPDVLKEVQTWFDTTTIYENSLHELFYEYTQSMTDKPVGEFNHRCVMSYEDFGRALYALGIVDVSTASHDRSLYRQLASWRPSLNQIKRWKV